MSPLARIQLTRTPARAEAPPPKKLRDDRVEREFGEELENETTKKLVRPDQTPTVEQLALAGAILPQLAKPEAPAQTFEAAFAQIQETAAAAPQLALAPTPELTSDAGEAEELPATPLEQAVIDMLDQHEAMPEVVAIKTDIQRDVPAPRIAQPAAIAAPRELPEQAAPTSHVNLVMDDGDRRVVVTVAVRGNDVNVHLRGGDDLAAGLARNAGSLDEAMRARGLSLAELTARREPDPQEQRERPQYERRESVKEVFTLEENA